MNVWFLLMQVNKLYVTSVLFCALIHEKARDEGAKSRDSNAYSKPQGQGTSSPSSDRYVSARIDFDRFLRPLVEFLELTRNGIGKRRVFFHTTIQDARVHFSLDALVCVWLGSKCRECGN